MNFWALLVSQMTLTFHFFWVRLWGLNESKNISIQVQSAGEKSVWKGKNLIIDE